MEYIQQGFPRYAPCQDNIRNRVTGLYCFDRGEGVGEHFDARKFQDIHTCQFIKIVMRNDEFRYRLTDISFDFFKQRLGSLLLFQAKTRLPFLPTLYQQR